MNLQSKPTAAARPIPRQRVPATTRRVTTVRVDGRWSYRVEGEPDLGHSFADRDQAVAGGRYLAKTLGAEHVVENEDGSVCEQVDCAEVCSCHPRDAAQPDG